MEAVAVGADDVGPAPERLVRDNTGDSLQIDRPHGADGRSQMLENLLRVGGARLGTTQCPRQLAFVEIVVATHEGQHGRVTDHEGDARRPPTAASVR